jgi:hypothetical protein
MPATIPPPRTTCINAGRTTSIGLLSCDLFCDLNRRAAAHLHARRACLEASLEPVGFGP